MTETETETQAAAEMLRTELKDAVEKAAANAEHAEMHACFCVDRAADTTCARTRSVAERRARVATQHAVAWRKVLSAIVELASNVDEHAVQMVGGSHE